MKTGRAAIRSSWGVVDLEVTFPAGTLTRAERARIDVTLDKALSELLGEIPTVEMVPVAAARPGRRSR